MVEYFYKCNKLESRMVSDGIGGYKVIDTEGIEFEGLAVRKGSTEQLIGALRGKENILYTFHTYANVPLQKDDKVKYTEAGVDKYIRLTSSEQINTELSMQTEWKSYDAESYTPIF